ncbi:acyl-CoA N-acyltransferase, partial [Westerdykella ornata]
PSISNAFTLKPLPPNVELVPLTEELMPSFKRLNSLLLPIPYPAHFYAETMTEPHHSVTLMAVWHATPLNEDNTSSDQKPQLVGAIRCRVLPANNLYISTIGLLAPFRSHGIATHLLQRIAAKAAQEHGVKYITAHVWEANEDGLEWYKKRGFEVIGREEQYYRKLKPSGAVLVKRPVGVGDLLGS